MDVEEARRAIVRSARTMESDGLTVATSGNLSVRCGDLVVITPSGVPYPSLEPSMVPVCDAGGDVVEGDLAPSSELPMHLAVYEATGCGAIVHPHSVHATVLSVLVDELPPVHYLVAALGGGVRVARYETYGTDELAEAVVEALGDRTAALMAHHGSITIGHTLDVAYQRARWLEWLCEVYYLASRGGTPSLLSDGEISRVQDRMRSYGQQAGGS